VVDFFKTVALFLKSGWGMGGVFVVVEILT
jgi:hypothetical protein